MQDLSQVVSARYKLNAASKKLVKAPKVAGGKGSSSKRPRESASKAKPPVINDRVNSKWMYGKKDEVPHGSKTQVGKWYPGKVTKVDVEAMTADIEYEEDGYHEENVAWGNIKLQVMFQHM